MIYVKLKRENFEMNIAILKKIGLSDKEIKVYLGLLEYGAISVRGLADLVGLNRGTVYDTLKKLQEQSLVSYYHHETKQKFVAEQPEKLYNLVDVQEAKIKRIKHAFKELIPELKSLQGKGGDKPTSKFYEGKNGIRYILEDILEVVSANNNKEYYVYSATNASDDIYQAYPNFTKDRIQKKIHVKAISLAEGGSLSGLDERQWLGTNEDSATFFLIYSGKIAYISRDGRGNPIGVIIQNQMMYETQRVIFMGLWDNFNA